MFLISPIGIVLLNNYYSFSHNHIEQYTAFPYMFVSWAHICTKSASLLHGYTLSTISNTIYTAGAQHPKLWTRGEKSPDGFDATWPVRFLMRDMRGMATQLNDANTIASYMPRLFYVYLYIYTYTWTEANILLCFSEKTKGTFFNINCFQIDLWIDFNRLYKKPVQVP